MKSLWMLILTIACVDPGAPAGADPSSPIAACVPDGVERCDWVDNDCNGLVDDDATDAPVWYLDADGDGRGDVASPLAACAAPELYVVAWGDCDDLDAGRLPGAAELCNGRDDNCVDGVDENLTWFDLYLDEDGDGFGSGDPFMSGCDLVPGASAAGGDCDDLATGTYPGAVETCDGVDENCDGETDEGLPGRRVVGTDIDGDGYVNLDQTHLACAARPFEVYAGPVHDCDDFDAGVHAGAQEICDQRDNDCDRATDDSDGSLITDPALGGRRSWYFDSDGDGVGGSYWRLACFQPSGYVSVTGDCNDYDRWVTTQLVWLDADFDGYGDPAVPLGCYGGVRNDDDCDDADRLRNPGAARYIDGDGDGYGKRVVLGHGCDAAWDDRRNGGDCRDEDPDIHPAAIDACDGVDNNCSGNESDAVDRVNAYVDDDGDGEGAGAPRRVCEITGQLVDNNLDCDDNAPLLNSQTPWYADVDGDGEAAATSALVGRGCASMPGASRWLDDCDDLDPEVFGLRGWYLDEDGDGVGPSDISEQSCVNPDPAVYTDRTGDCDDHDPASATWCTADTVPLIVYVGSSQTQGTMTCGDQAFVVDTVPREHRVRAGTCTWEPGGRNSSYDTLYYSGCTAMSWRSVYRSAITVDVPQCTGCADPGSPNFVSANVIDDGSCLYPTLPE